MQYKHDTGMLVFDRDDVYACNCLSGTTYSADAAVCCNSVTSAYSSLTDATSISIDRVDTLSDRVNELNLSIDSKVAALGHSLKTVQEEIKYMKAAMFGGRSRSMRKGPVSRTLIFDSVEDFERVYQC